MHVHAYANTGMYRPSGELHFMRNNYLNVSSLSLFQNACLDHEINSLIMTSRLSPMPINHLVNYIFMYPDF